MTMSSISGKQNREYANPGKLRRIAIVTAMPRVLTSVLNED
jgi:hypothetical protein